MMPVLIAFQSVRSYNEPGDQQCCGKQSLFERKEVSFELCAQ